MNSRFELLEPLPDGRTRRKKGDGLRLNFRSEFRIWKAMKERCLSPKDKRFVNYGGRGIRVCERWMKFENFLRDMGPKPDGYSIERIDVNGNYEPGNCKWIPLADQQLNRTDMKLMDAFGESKQVSSWARDSRCVVSRSVINRRLKDGWSLETALTTPPQVNQYL